MGPETDLRPGCTIWMSSLSSLSRCLETIRVWRFLKYSSNLLCNSTAMPLSSIVPRPTKSVVNIRRRRFVLRSSLLTLSSSVWLAINVSSRLTSLLHETPATRLLLNRWRAPYTATATYNNNDTANDADINFTLQFTHFFIVPDYGW